MTTAAPSTRIPIWKVLLPVFLILACAVGGLLVFRDLAQKARPGAVAPPGRAFWARSRNTSRPPTAQARMRKTGRSTFHMGIRVLGAAVVMRFHHTLE